MTPRLRRFTLAALASVAAMPALAAERPRQSAPPRAIAPQPSPMAPPSASRSFTAPALEITTDDGRVFDCPFDMAPPVAGAPLPPVIEYLTDPVISRRLQATFRDETDAYIISLFDSAAKAGTYYVHYKATGNNSFFRETAPGVPKSAAPKTFDGQPINYVAGTRFTLCALLVGDADAAGSLRRMLTAGYVVTPNYIAYGPVAPTPPEPAAGPAPEANARPR